MLQPMCGCRNMDHEFNYFYSYVMRAIHLTEHVFCSDRYMFSGVSYAWRCEIGQNIESQTVGRGAMKVQSAHAKNPSGNFHVPPDVSFLVT